MNWAGESRYGRQMLTIQGRPGGIILDFCIVFIQRALYLGIHIKLSLKCFRI